jgi:hypothetical protein
MADAAGDRLSFVETPAAIVAGRGRAGLAPLTHLLVFELFTRLFKSGLLGATHARILQIHPLQASTTACETTIRVNHLLSAGTTYQGACLLAV